LDVARVWLARIPGAAPAPVARSPRANTQGITRSLAARPSLDYSLILLAKEERML
jgi:hypothetical protein